LECQTEADPNNPNDPTRFIPGKCANLFQDAAESPKLPDVVSSLHATDLAIGAANRLLAKCDTRVCTEECVPSYFKSIKPIAISADILSMRNAAGESALGDLIADAQRAIAQVDFALVAPSEADPTDGIIGLLFAATPGRPADAEGRVLRSEILGAMLGYSGYVDTGGAFAPYDSNLFKVTLTGEKIYAALEQQFGSVAIPSTGQALYVSGLTYTWDAEKPPAARVVEVRKEGVALDKAANYTAVLGTRLIAPSGPIKALAGVEATLLPNVDPTELVGEYMSQLPQPVAPPEVNRITRLH
jgi:5'-nucleotidase